MANKIEIGDICALDKDNSLNMSTDKCCFVKIIQPKFNLRVGRYYLCQLCDRAGNITNLKTLYIKKSLLTKLEDTTVVIIRHPNDTPIIAKEDLEALLWLKQVSISNLYSQPIISQRIDMLITKLRLLTTIIHEY